MNMFVLFRLYPKREPSS